MIAQIRRNWKRIVISQAISFAIQGAVFAGLVALGVNEFPAPVAAKGTSWAQFVTCLALSFARKGM